MKQSYFVEEMKKLAKVFGSQNYPQERVRLIWEQVEDLSEWQFTKIVEHFCADRNVNFPPMRKDFIEESQRHRTTQKEKELKQFTRMVEQQPSDGSALRKLLDQMGVKSVKEAVFKKRGGTQ